MQKKHSLANYPAEKHLKRNKLAVTDTPEKPVDFLNNTGRQL